MEELMIERDTFTHGLLSEGKYFKDFTLEEEVMKHTLDVANDLELDIPRLIGNVEENIPEDETYYSACLLAKRLTVEGVEKVTPEMVLGLSRTDGRLLLRLSSRLDKRRELFRDEAAANQKGHPGAPEAGLQGGGNHKNEPGGDS
jgi:hypothetical protein